MFLNVLCNDFLSNGKEVRDFKVLMPLLKPRLKEADEEIWDCDVIQGWPSPFICWSCHCPGHLHSPELLQRLLGELPGKLGVLGGSAGGTAAETALAWRSREATVSSTSFPGTRPSTPSFPGSFPSSLCSSFGEFALRVPVVAYGQSAWSFWLTIEIGFVFFAYRGKSVWSYLLTVPPVRKLGLVFFCLRFPHRK